VKLRLIITCRARILSPSLVYNRSRARAIARGLTASDANDAGERNILRNIIHIDAYSAAGYLGDISDLLFIENRDA